MSKVETIEEFYKKKFDWMPDNLLMEIVSYKRRNYFKIMLVICKGEVHFAEQATSKLLKCINIYRPKHRLMVLLQQGL